jgi:hypothetical protein
VRGNEQNGADCDDAAQHLGDASAPGTSTANIEDRGHRVIYGTPYNLFGLIEENNP